MTKKVATKEDPKAEVIKMPPKFDEDELRALDNWEAAIALTQEQTGTIASAAEEMGDGFRLLDTKEKRLLIGVPCIFMEWRFSMGDMGEFVSARIAARHGHDSLGKYIINDGSTGIYSQLLAYTEKHNVYGGLVSERGLRVSNYEWEDPNTGEKKPATTFYIDTSV